MTSLLSVTPERASWGQTHVCVVGAGYMGSGIAQTLARAGADVVVVDADAERAHAGLARMHEQTRDHVVAGLLPEGSVEAVEARTRAADSIALGSPGSDLVIEAVYENPDLKRAVLAEAEQHAGPEAVIATNTSSIPIGELAVALADPSRFLGLHWFNPPQYVPGVEVIPIEATRAGLADTMQELLRAAGKWPALVSDTPGFVGNRLQFALFREAALMLAEGIATAEQIDEVVRGSFGYRLPFFGPFAIADMAGLDVYAAAFGIMEAAYGERFSVPPQLTELVESGHLGTKSGGGFIDRTADEIARTVARRDRSYVELQALIERAEQQ
jgi:3-hydroxybutyryl-CoA dehydrogenase